MGPDSSGLASLFKKKKKELSAFSLAVFLPCTERSCQHSGKEAAYTPKGKPSPDTKPPLKHLYLGLTVSKTVRKQIVGV